MTNNLEKKIPVFISWAGNLANIFSNEYILSITKLIGEYVEPFFSRDIPAGNKWYVDISEALKASKIGIIFLTPDSLKSSWVLFESGALAVVSTEQKTYTFPLLIGVNWHNKNFKDSPISNLQCQNFNPQENDSTIGFLKNIVIKVLEIKKISYDYEFDKKVTEEAIILHDKLTAGFNQWETGHKTHLPEIELVDFQDSTNQFNNFVDKYIAFNAPLVYEQEGNNFIALQEHIDRYKVNKTQAEYFYPIFAIFDLATLSKWLKIIYPFFKELNKHLDDEERTLITFYAPEFSKNPFLFLNKFSYDLGFTFFLGDKKDDSELVCIYMHNRIYSSLTSTDSPLVKKYFIIRNSNDCELHKRFITEEQLRSPANYMKKMNLSNFLQYCEEIINELENEDLEFQK